MCSVIQFLAAGDDKGANIHGRMKAMYRDICLSEDYTLSGCRNLKLMYGSCMILCRQTSILDSIVEGEPLSQENHQDPSDDFAVTL
jgi:hypothetical protein